MYSISFEYDIINSETGAIVYNFLPELKEDYDHKQTFTGKLYPSFEGTVLRFWFGNNQWNISTRKCIDAFKARWASRTSFGAQFRRFIEKQDLTLIDFFSKLDTEICYFFLLGNEGENVVNPNCVSPSCRLALIGYQRGREFNYEPQIAGPWEIIPPITLEGESLADKFTEVYLVEPISRIKYVSPQQARALQIRGNEPFLAVRFLQIRQDEELAALEEDFLQLYSFDHNALLGKINALVFDLTHVYIQRYNYGKYYYTRPDKHLFLKKCAEDACRVPTQSKNGKMTKNEVFKFISARVYEDNHALVRMLS